MNAPRLAISITTAFLFIGLCTSVATAQPADNTRKDSTAPSSTRITLAAVGDLMAHESQIKAGRRADGTYNFDQFFEHVAPLLSSADIATGNLETVTAGEQAKYTGYPAFNTPDAYVTACKAAGFDVLTTANNHSFDRRYLGVARTLDVLDSVGILHTGTTRSLKERSKPIVVGAKGIRLGFIAYAYNLNDGPAPVRYASTVNVIDTAAIGADIDSLRAMPPSQRPHKILACLHWGSEYQLTPNAKQTKLADWCFRRGVDVVLGAHPHVVQTVEKKKSVRAESGATKDTVECVAMYSMGNFISSQRPVPRETGVIVWLEFEKPIDSERVTIHSTQFTPTYVHKFSRNGKPDYTIFPIPQTLQEIQEGKHSLPEPVVKRLGNALQEITKQFATPDSSFTIRR